MPRAFLQASQHPRRCGFPLAVGPQQARQLALGYLKIQVIDSRRVTQVVGKVVVYFDNTHRSVRFLPATQPGIDGYGD